MKALGGFVMVGGLLAAGVGWWLVAEDAPENAIGGGTLDPASYLCGRLAYARCDVLFVEMAGFCTQCAQWGSQKRVRGCHTASQDVYYAWLRLKEDWYVLFESQLKDRMYSQELMASQEGRGD